MRGVLLTSNQLTSAPNLRRSLVICSVHHNVLCESYRVPNHGIVRVRKAVLVLVSAQIVAIDRADAFLHVLVLLDLVDQGVCRDIHSSSFFSEIL